MTDETFKRRLSECTPVAMAKAIKNETEIAGIVASHIRDAAALCRYFAWLEANVPSGTVDEISGAAVLQQYRYQYHSSIFVDLLTRIYS